MISLVNQWAGAFAPLMWKATWQGGLFVAIVWMVCRLAPRIPAWARYWVWWLACLQFAVRLASVSVLALPVLPSSETVVGPKVFAVIEERGPLPVVQAPVSLPTPAPESLSASAIGGGLWLLGVGVAVSLNARRLLCARKLTRHASTLRDPRVAEIVDEICGDHGMRTPRVLVSSDAPCALLTGWFRPSIVIPEDLYGRASDVELRMAISHELSHLKRRDLWFAIAPALCQVFFFFHPLAWLASRETTVACEEACDIEALRMTAGSPAAYARLLLDFAQSKSSIAALGAAFGYRMLQRRISMLNRSVLSVSSRYRRASIAAIAITAVCALPWSVTAQVSPPAPVSPNAHPAPVAKASMPAPKHHAKRRKGSKQSPKAVAAPNTPVPMAMTAGSPPAPGTTAPVAKPAIAKRASQAQTWTFPVEVLHPVVPAIQQSQDGLTIHLRHADLESSLADLFKAANQNFTIRSDVQAEKVTCGLTNIPFETALKLILSATTKQELTYRVEAGVYIVYPRVDHPAGT